MHVHLTLHTLGQVSEVEDVVGFGWSREQVHTHAVIDLHGSVHYTACSLFHCSWEITQEATQNRLQTYSHTHTELNFLLNNITALL